MHHTGYLEIVIVWLTVLSLEGTRIIYVPGANLATFSRPYDNGTTWTTIDNTILMAVCRFYNATTGYAGSFFITGPPFSAGIYKSAITFNPLAITNTRAAENKKDLVKIYPAPADDLINISLAEDQMKTTSMINVLSMEGKVLESKSSLGVKVQKCSTLIVP